jgi:alpha-tubulin suppressor-like RCC1 family protein
MALNGSGPISLAGATVGESIAIELGESATGTRSLNDTIVRDLAEVASGAITMPTNFWGKSSVPDYELWGWGYGLQSSIGVGNNISYSSPVQVLPYVNWTAVADSDITSFGILADGTLWSWGANTYGILGQGASSNKSTPTQVGALTNWSTISSSYQALSVKTDGTLWSWGMGTLGRLGLGNTTSYSSPKQVGSGTSWAQVSAGAYGHSLARTTGRVYLGLGL